MQRLILTLALSLAPCFLFTSCVAMGGVAVGSSKHVYTINEDALAAADPAKTSIEITLSDQKARLRDDNGEILVETMVSTGTDGYETPPGSYKVLERLEAKASNIYGQWVNQKTGKVVIERAWEHEGPPPANAAYQGIDMPYWLRLTWDGIGMHVGKFKPYTRSSFGCIRVPSEVQPRIWEKTIVGTPIEVIP
jgi:hypothetical protein